MEKVAYFCVLLYSTPCHILQHNRFVDLLFLINKIVFSFINRFTTDIVQKRLDMIFAFVYCYYTFFQITCICGKNL